MENEQEIIKSYPQPYHYDTTQMVRSAVYASITIALFMAAYFAVVKLLFQHIPTAAHYIQYILIFGFMNLFLISQKKNTGYKEPFVAKGITAGAIVSVLTAVFFFIVELIVYQFIPNATVSDRFGMQDDTDTSPAMGFVFVAMETFIFGMLSAFIAFQYLKRPPEKSQTGN